MEITRNSAAVLDVKALDDKSGEFEGYASTFGGEPDSYGDVIAAGAFAQSLADHATKGTMPKMFWQHDSREPIGRWQQTKEDARGLWVKGQLNMAVRRGQEAYAHLKAGDIDGLSIGYRIKEYSINEDTGVWTLLRLDLKEISVVSIGANENATIVSVKSARALVEIKEKLAAGELLTVREFEELAKGLGLSNSQAERAARIHLKGQGEPAKAASDALDFLRALKG